jgi:hypothetical protein
MSDWHEEMTLQKKIQFFPRPFITELEPGPNQSEIFSGR